MPLIVNIIPLLVILAILFFRQHMLVAGLAGGLLAVVIGGLWTSFPGIFLDGINNMLSITVPILYASVAALVAKGGGIDSVVELAKRGLKGRVAILGAVMVLIQAFATYAAGLGAGNTMVTAPLVAAAVGAVPEVIAAMAIATAAGFTTSPASTETAVTANNAGTEVLEHVTAMQPFTFTIFVLAALLAAYGVYRRGTMIRRGAEGQDTYGVGGMTVVQLWKTSIPAIVLLVLVVAGGTINGFIGIPLFTPPLIVVIVAILTFLFTDLGVKKVPEELVSGSQFILTTLFSVGIFLGFINMIAENGTFEQLAGLVENVPEAIVVPAAMVVGFLVAIPSGAFTAGVLTLTLPTLGALGLSTVSMGLVAIATGLGTQISPVQINVVALSGGFDISIIDVIKKNAPYVIGAFVILLVVAFVRGFVV